MKQVILALFILLVVNGKAFCEPGAERIQEVAQEAKNLRVGDTVIYILTVEERGKIIAFFKPTYFFKGEIIGITGSKYKVSWDNGVESIVSVKNLGRYTLKK